MHPFLPHPSVTPPQPRPPAGNAAADHRDASTPSDLQLPTSQDLVGDFGPLVRRPAPDWDWGPDDERRRN